MSAVEVQHYVRRAQDFYEGTVLLRDDPHYRNSTALLAIHTAISYADALRTGLGDGNMSAEDHGVAPRSLRRLLGGHTMRMDDGLRHLEVVLGKKSAVAYGNSRLSAKEYEAILAHSDRFTAWANVSRAQSEAGRVARWR